MSTEANEKLIKQPAESRLYSIDFANLLGTGESLSGTPTVTASPTGLTIGTPAISGTTVQVRISSGSDGVPYKLECVVATSDGNTLEGDAILIVMD